MCWEIYSQEEKQSSLEGLKNLKMFFSATLPSTEGDRLRSVLPIDRLYTLEK